MAHGTPAKSIQIFIPSLTDSGRPVVLSPLPVFQSGGPFYLEAIVGQGMPYFRWFPKDYAGDAMVQAMTDDQDLIYRRLLDMSWQIGPLPSEPEDLARLVRFDLERFEAAWRFPLTECWHRNGSKKIINHRLEEERESTLDRSEKARFAVKCREEKRAKRVKGKKKAPIIVRSSDVHLGAIHPDPYSDPDPDPDTDKEEEKKRKPRRPQFVVEWGKDESGEDDFVGDHIKALKDRLKDRYMDDFGYSWINSIWVAIIEWCQDNEPKIRAKKDVGAFILGWYRREAERERKK